MTTITKMAEQGARPKWCYSSDRRPGIECASETRHTTHIFATWEAAINFLVPIGYEDESGFHYGEPRRN